MRLTVDSFFLRNIVFTECGLKLYTKTASCNFNEFLEKRKIV